MTWPEAFVCGVSILTVGAVVLALIALLNKKT